MWGDWGTEGLAEFMFDEAMSETESEVVTGLPVDWNKLFDWLFCCSSFKTLEFLRIFLSTKVLGPSSSSTTTVEELIFELLR